MKDSISYQDVHDLLDFALSEFFNNDSVLLDYKTEKDAVAERCMVFHIGWYMLEKIKALERFEGFNIDCEYNRNFSHPKSMYKETYEGIRQKIKDTYPDLIIHKRRSNDENLVVMEFKKGRAEKTARDQDIEKLIYFTNPENEYRYKYGFYLELYKMKYAKIKVFQDGKEMGSLNYKFEAIT